MSTPTFRLFVSSTFSDMKAEREILQAKVFPKLRDYCKSKGAMFQAVDLRWGISEEAGLDQQTMNICLRELRRCQETTDKPNFLILLGDRYGWLPLPPQIDAREFEKLEKVLTTESTENTERLKRWYRRDDNAVPAQYVLLPREGEFEEFGNWDREEKAVRKLFLRALETAGWPAADPRREKYEHSATHQEIDAGALALPDPEDRVLACFRTIKNLPEASDTFSDHDPDGTRDEKARQQLNDLRTALEDRIPESHRYSYEAESLCASVPLRENLHFDQDAFTAWVEDSFRKIIDREIEEKQAKAADPLDQENAEHEAFGRERAHRFVGRKDLLDQIGAYMHSTDPGQTPFIVHGVSGTGKTALMGKAVLAHRHPSDQSAIRDPQSEILLERYIGATPGSSNLRSLLVDLCQQLHRALDFEALKAAEPEGHGGAAPEEVQKQREAIEQKYGIPDDLNKLIEHFRCLPARVPEDRRLVLFLDALDQLDDEGNPCSLAWLPDRLPGNVRVVVSVLDRHGEAAGRAAESARRRFPDALHEIAPLATGDAGELLAGWLADAGRALQPAQRQSMLQGFAECGLPLWLKLVSEEARTWHAWQEPEALPVTIPELLDHFLGELEEPGRHGRELVSTALGYLAAARNGLADEELLDVVALDENFWTHFTATARREHQIPERRLPPVLWARLHGDLAFALTQRHADNATLHTFYHRQIAEAARRRYLDPRSRDLHSRLGDYFNAQPHYHEGKPNLRKLSELVPQWITGECWDDLIGDEKRIGPLSDLLFIQAKCAAGRVYDLVADYNAALAALPEFAEENAWLAKRDAAMIAYNKALGESAKERYDWLRATERGENRQEPPYPSLPGEIKGEANMPLPEESSPRAARLRHFSNFVSDYIGPLNIYPCDTLPLAFNSAEDGPVHDLSQRQIQDYHRLWLKRSPRPPLPPLRPQCLRTLEGHSDDVSCVSVSPDGRYVVSGSWDNTVRVWDLETGECLRTLVGHSSSVSSVSVSPEGRRAISGSLDKTLRVWDLETGQCMRILEGYSGDTMSVSPDGRRAVSSRDNTVRVWDLETGECLRTIFAGHGLSGQCCVCLMPDGMRAISGGKDKTLRIWELESGRCLRILEENVGPIHGVCVTPDGKHLISASNCDEGGKLHLWDIDHGKCLQTFEGHKMSVKFVCVTPDGKTAISASFGGTLLVWDVVSGVYIHSLEGHSGPVKSICMTPDGRRVVSGSGGTTWDINDRSIKVWNIAAPANPTSTDAHNGGVQCLSISTHSKRVVSAADHPDITPRVWDLESGRCLHVLQGHSRRVFHACLTPDGALVASRDADGALRVWSTASGKCLSSLDGNGRGSEKLCVFPDGKRIASGNSDKTVQVWDANTGSCIKILKGHSKTVEALSVSPDGCRILSGSGSLETSGHSVRLWEVDTGLCLASIETPSVSEISFTPDGICAAGRLSPLVNAWHFWRIGEKLDEVIMKGHTDSIKSLCVTPEGRYALTGSRDTTVRVWDLASLSCRSILAGHDDEVASVCVTPDGKYAVSGSYDRTVRIWSLDTADHLGTYVANSHVHTVAISGCGNHLICGTQDGNVHFLTPVNFPPTGPAILTAFKTRASRCPACGDELSPPQTVLSAIQGKSAIELTSATFDNPRLLTTCPKCAKPLKYNPFFVREWTDHLDVPLTPRTPASTASSLSAPSSPIPPALRISAKESLRKGHWEAAETFLTKLLAAGDPKQEIIPDLVLCLVNAHETVSDFNRAKIDQLLADLEQAGRADLAAQLRQQHAAKLNPHNKPWWRVW